MERTLPSSSGGEEAEVVISRLCRLHSSRAAAIATAISVVASATIATMKAQSSASSSSAIEAASSAHKSLFLVYLFVLVAAAIATVVFTYLVWKSGGRVQDAIRADAEAKIAAVNLEVAQQRRRAAEAELALTNIHRVIQTRRIVFGSDPPERVQLFNELKKFAGTQSFVATIDDPEAKTLAGDIFRRLKDAGWSVEAAPQYLEGVLLNRMMSEEGVRLITMENSPFDLSGKTLGPQPSVSDADPRWSDAGKAARTASLLFALDLKPAFFGVRWEQLFVEDPRPWLKLPLGVVGVLVGPRPLTFGSGFLPTPQKPK
jgi:hypothetical protein